MCKKLTRLAVICMACDYLKINYSSKLLFQQLPTFNALPTSEVFRSQPPASYFFEIYFQLQIFLIISFIILTFLEPSSGTVPRSLTLNKLHSTVKLNCYLHQLTVDREKMGKTQKYQKLTIKSYKKYLILVEGALCQISNGSFCRTVLKSNFY